LTRRNGNRIKRKIQKSAWGKRDQRDESQCIGREQIGENRGPEEIIAGPSVQKKRGGRAIAIKRYNDFWPSSVGKSEPHRAIISTEVRPKVIKGPSREAGSGCGRRKKKAASEIKYTAIQKS